MEQTLSVVPSDRYWRGEQLIAAWETRGKERLELITCTAEKEYRYINAYGRSFGCFSAPSHAAAVARMTAGWNAPEGPGAVTVLKSDRPSLRQVYQYEAGVEPEPHKGSLLEAVNKLMSDTRYTPWADKGEIVAVYFWVSGNRPGCRGAKFRTFGRKKYYQTDEILKVEDIPPLTGKDRKTADGEYVPVGFWRWRKGRVEESLRVSSASKPN